MSRPPRGLTLLELLVALTVTGLVVLAAHAVLTSVTDAWARARTTRERTMAAATARATLEHWLRAATLLPGAGPFQGRRYRAGRHPLDELTLAVGDAGTLWPGPHRVHLWIARDPLTPTRGLVAELRPLVDSTLALPETLAVVPEAAGLELRYRVSLDGHDVWVDAWESPTQLPQVIALRLVAIAPVHLGADAPAAPDLPPLLTLPLVVPVTMSRF